MESRIRELTQTGLLISVALAAAYLESLLPVFVAVPGIKLGLANAVVMLVLYKKNLRSAVLVSGVRIILAAVLFSGMFTMIYSLAGAVLSLGVMVLLKRTNLFSTVGVSVAGGVMHNVGQILVAMIVIENQKMLYYLPFLMVSGVISGIVIGIITGMLIQKMPLLDNWG